jgi:hypothetical protein
MSLVFLYEHPIKVGLLYGVTYYINPYPANVEYRVSS